MPIKCKYRLRPAHLLTCIALMALFLSAAILVPPASQARLSGGASRVWSGVIPTSLMGASRSKSALHFPLPLPSVNDSQTANYPVQVGAAGNQDSIGNDGVQAEIQTNSYNVSGQAEDAFWVGDVLNNGAFVQFGYLILSPGYYCLKGHITANRTACTGIADNLGYSDARWFWAYFPSAVVIDDWYYGFGPRDSAGANDTWHLYSISPSTNGWNFVLDGVMAYSSNFPSAPSTSPVHVVAEKASSSSIAPLGPVEFRNLAYLANDGLWHGTSSLIAIDSCAAGGNSTCNMTVGYGVEPNGVNGIIAGSKVSVTEPGQTVWQRKSACSLNTELMIAGGAGTAPLNVTFIDLVSSAQAQAGLRTDWWYGDGSYQQGNSSQTVTYRTPGNYTPLVRVLDSSGCLSEASGEVSVNPPDSSTSLEASTWVLFSFVVRAIALAVVPQSNGYGPNQ